MNMLNVSVNKDEETILRLCDLYERRGYMKYKMSKFEEYDFYMENKSFLQSKNILTFSDPSGKLMALKPDITLSIIKNIKDSEKEPEKVYYKENVYRVVKGGQEFREIMQMGLECIGDIDLYTMGEVICLAVRSLQTVSEQFILDVSHVGVTAALLDAAGLQDVARKKMTSSIGAKNSDEIRILCRQYEVDKALTESIVGLSGIYGSFKSAIEKAESYCVNDTMREAMRELKEVYRVLESMDCAENVNLDFSIVNDMDYYSGVIFQGFIKGIPVEVLYGGRYDNLLHRMDKKGQAIGFAVYLGQLEQYETEEKEFDVDVLIRYDEDDDPVKIAETADAALKLGRSVRVQKSSESSLRAKQYISVKDGSESLG